MDTITPQNGLDFEHSIRTYSNSARFRMRREGKEREGKGRVGKGTERNGTEGKEREAGRVRKIYM